MFENFFDFNVALPVWVISQIIGAIGIGVAFWSFQVKRKTKFLVIIGSSNIILAISVALLLNWVVFALLCLACIRNFTFAYLERRREHGKSTANGVPLILMVGFLIANIIAVSLTWVWWFDFVLLVASCSIIFGGWLKNTHVFRLSCMTYDSLMFVNFIKFSNAVGLIQSTLLVSSVLIFYIRFFIGKRKVRTSVNDTKV